MKPVVSIMHAWSCIIISVFAIVILSVLGALFNASHHSLMDSNDDPKDGTVVAATAFGAVGVYGVVLPCLLWPSGMAARARVEAWSHRFIDTDDMGIRKNRAAADLSTDRAADIRGCG
ncbi:hypothetical protein V498_10726 [Pseudogymnoascus sp. VKM F-4517 (FW-2822)]|nr:hypothetical protein V498_10726 [Pseudogymnoascus sp. VKM F-4517 (FW-2822)]